LLGVGVLFWGAMTGYLPYALVMASVLELPGVAPYRWELRDRDFERVCDLCAVLLAGVTLYQFDEHGFHAIFPILKAAPFVLFPLVLAQRFSTRDCVKFSALFLSVRRVVRRGRLEHVRSIDICYPFLAACLLAAGSGSVVPGVYLPALIVFAAWLAVRHRPPGSPHLPFVLAVLGAALFAWTSKTGMLEMRRGVEPLLLQLFQERLWDRRDPYRTQTAIGYIGRLKVSQRIVARVRPIGDTAAPPRLRESVYRAYSRQMWLAPGVKFSRVPAIGGGSVWKFGSALARDAPAVRISSSLRDGRGVLLLPNGTRQLEGLNVESLGRNGLGTVKVSEGPGLIEFTARFAGADTTVEEPGPEDLRVPKTEQALFRRLGTELGLQGTAPSAIVRKIRAFFADGFRYSLVGRSRAGLTPLETFLNETRAGHCEYFATATVLLLRAAGVPARYVSGYAVNEWSPLERAFVVRRRHAHSWASAYVGGAWRDVDTTPAVWFEDEASAEPWWTGTYDVMAWLRYRFDQWRYSDSDWGDAETLVGSAILLSGVLAWRLLRRTRRVSRRVGQTEGQASGSPQVSEFYAAVRLLEKDLGPREPGETWRRWFRRAGSEGRGGAALDGLLDDLVRLHYRLRFHPGAKLGEARRAVREAAARWAAKHYPGKL